MRTTLVIDDALLAEAQRAAKLPTKTATVARGLELILQQAAAERLIALRGTLPNVRAPRRRRA